MTSTGRNKELFFFLVLCINLLILVTCDEDDHNNTNLTYTPRRDKRTLDFVLRGFADVFGYDVLKRPSVLPPAAPPARVSPTVFPPPVAPLPPPARRPPVAPRRPQPPVAPRKPPAGNPPPPPPPQPVAPKGNPAVPKAPSVVLQQVTAPPLLTETVRKNFNINLLWGTNRQTSTVAPPPAPARRPPVVPTRAQPSKIQQFQQPEQFQLFQQPQQEFQQQQQQFQQPQQQFQQPQAQFQQPLDYEDDVESLHNRYRTTNSYEENLHDYLYDEVTRAPLLELQTNLNLNNNPMVVVVTDDPNHQQQNKDKFKESITEFWNNSPWREQKGYKFLTTPVSSVQISGNEVREYPEELENEAVEDYEEDYPRRKYQEADIEEEVEQHLREEVKRGKPDYEDEDDIEEEEEMEKYRVEESKEIYKLPNKQQQQVRTQQKNNVKIVVNKTRSKPTNNNNNNKTSKKAEKTKITNLAYRNVKVTTDKLQSHEDDVIEPQFSGVLPSSLHRLYSTDDKDNRRPWPLPFDAELSETKLQHHHSLNSLIDPRRRSDPENQRIRVDNSASGKGKVSFITKRKVAETETDNYDVSNFKYQPDKYNPDFSGYEVVVPEASTEDYAKYDQRENYDEDEDVKKAQVLTRSFGTRINVVKSNNVITSLNK